MIAIVTVMLIIIILTTSFIGCENNKTYSQNKKIYKENKNTVSKNENLDFAQVEYVEIKKISDEIYNISVTIRHNDESWDHYADTWQVIDARTQEVLGERILSHPHDNEQPFTRSLSNVKISKDITNIIIKGKCNLHSYEGKKVNIDLNVLEGEDYIIK